MINLSKLLRSIHISKFSFYLLIILIVLSEYHGIANGSPWVVPSSDCISPPPAINNRAGLRYVLIKYVAIYGHVILTLWRLTDLFMVLKAIVASMSNTASVDSSSNKSRIAWIAASAPAPCPAQVWSGPAASRISSLQCWLIT